MLRLRRVLSHLTPNQATASAPGSAAATHGRRFQSKLVDVEVTDGVAVVTLTRAKKMNGLSFPMFEAVVSAAASVESDPSVKAVVLRGEGRAFCAGIDMSSMLQPSSIMERQASKLLERPADNIANLAQDLGLVWRKMKIPVVAAIHGVCFGGGLQLALGADVRFSTPDCRYSIMEAKWGM